MELEQLEKLIRAVSDSELSGFKYEENGIKPVSYTHLSYLR